MTCKYKVDNCQFCEESEIEIDTKEISPSCEYYEEEGWFWSLTNKTSELILIDQNIFFNKSVIFRGNLIVSFNSTFSFNVTQRELPPLVVVGCPSFGGYFHLFFDFLPKEDFIFVVVSFNCSSPPHLYDSQLLLSYSFPGSHCYSLNATSLSEKQSFSVKINSKNICKKGFSNFLFLKFFYFFIFFRFFL